MFIFYPRRCKNFSKRCMNVLFFCFVTVSELTVAKVSLFFIHTKFLCMFLFPDDHSIPTDLLYEALGLKVSM